MERSVKDRASEVRDWVLNARDSYGRLNHFIDGYARALREVGVPLDRLTLHLRQLNPQLRARTFQWNRDAGGAMETGRQYGIEVTDIYLRSTVRPIFEGGPAIERRLEPSKEDPEFPILNELRDQGFTHYLILPMSLWVLGPAALSIATRKPEGFSQDDLAVVARANAAFGMAVELQETRQLARTLLDTYVGHNAGERILSGAIRRGDSEEIHAVIFYCDLRNFTPLSEQCAQNRVIESLDRYFEAVSGPVQDHGGEILKFIGDGMLAIFPCPASHVQNCTAANSALTAAREAQAAMARLRENAPEFDLHCGIALHVGDVMFGNVGAANRLDFTVIGPAVNLVTRIEPQSKVAPGQIVVSREFADRESGRYESLGVFGLKGIAAEKEILYPLD
jgi:adenylate cyclase